MNGLGRNCMNKKQSIISITIFVILISCNLRAPITGAGSLISIISDDFSLSSGAAGMLTTLPLLAFAAVSPIVGSFSGKIGTGKLFILSIAVLITGIIIRSTLGEWGLFLGTLLLGMAIAIGNVMLPAVIKSKFPDRIEAMTSLYTVIMQIVAAVATAVGVPLSAVFGWRAALGIWVFTASAALAVCIVNRDLSISSQSAELGESERHNNGGRAAELSGKPAKRGMYSVPMTWWITFYMGVQSMMFYSFVAWLSPMLQSRGYGDEAAGYMLTVYVIMGMAGSAALSFIMKRNRSQSVTGVMLGSLYLLGMICMLLSPYLTGLLLPGIIVCGFCSGTCISFSMALFGLHTSDGGSASRLSGLAQSVGYLVAAVGPVVLGKIFDITQSWNIPLIILTAAAVFLIAAGSVVGRDEIIQ